MSITREGYLFVVRGAFGCARFETRAAALAWARRVLCSRSS